ncbi:AraC family transcriptional regulator [Pontiella agarivorans]|uniref:AraC family transcriptional regulator n=1 Tax=Pontiella agarivorans TaxID=3038953 RepID=A0ABU5MW30_9BACT|nr:AraC family transcriptional regulator [Pontiella agarivorans]MDZ8118398.1 AraC family transcriptional regulator [Pontiella agarivorans]
MKLAYEHIRKDVGTSFYAHRFEDRDFVHSYHVHEEAELIYIKAGRGRLVAGDYSGRFEAGELFLFGENLPHAFFSDTLQEKQPQRVCSLYVQFRPSCLGEHFFDLPEMEDLRRVLAKSKRGLKFSGFDSRRIEALFDDVLQARPVRRIACFIEIQDEISRCRNRMLASRQYLRAEVHHDSERLNRAIDYIHRKFTEAVTLDEIAAAAHLSPEAFSRFFKKYMGIPFIEYVIQLRLSEACRMLLETDLPITEIAFSVGFRNLSNFNRQFLKHKGSSPRDFRKVER